VNYQGLLQSIVIVHRESLGTVAVVVNRSLVLRNWLVGAYLVEFEQEGEERASYGDHLLERVSSDLKKRGVQGLGISMLKNCRQLYRLYPQVRQSLSGVFADSVRLPGIRQSLIGEFETTGNGELRATDCGPSALSADRLLRLSWTQLIELIRLDDQWKRAFYENECINGNWSVRQLKRQLGSLLYERTGLSADKRAVVESARQQPADTPAQLIELIRDPYVLEFAGLAEKPCYRESDLETALLDHLQNFLLELGSGFCFEARQKRITVGNEHDYIDLVFYHRRLRCHLLIDLKTRAFKHSDAGQMNFYLNYWRANEIDEGDSAPVGLLLCSDRSATRVQYATLGLDHRLFVSRYLLALPSEDQLRQWIEADRAAIESTVLEAPPPQTGTHD